MLYCFIMCRIKIKFSYSYSYMKKKIHLLWSTLVIYLLVAYKKNHSFWSTFVKDLKRNFSCKIFKKRHKNSKKVGFFLHQRKSAWND
jgi:hypothetical protein